MLTFKFTDKMLAELNLEDWRADNQKVCDELGIQRKLVSRPVSLEIIEALIHDARVLKEQCL